MRIQTVSGNGGIGNVTLDPGDVADDGTAFEKAKVVQSKAQIFPGGPSRKASEFRAKMKEEPKSPAFPTHVIQERPEHEDGSSHLLHQLVRRFV